MQTNKNGLVYLLSFLIAIIFYNPVNAQDTTIRGFIETNSTFEDDKVSFGFGEQDLFITSELTDHISFLSETVFRYDANSSTQFSVSIERVIIKYNYKDNHNILIGKHHTPVNFWNDTYHHGRVFFPTIDRPHLFKHDFIPLHTTGISFQGLNLGKKKVGYNLMIGNGIGSMDIADNNKFKSLTAAINFEPLKKLKVGASFYSDRISAGSMNHGNLIDEDVKQQLYTGSVSHFGRQFEILAEATVGSNDAQSSGKVHSFAGYIYAGVKINEKWIPYVRFDKLEFNDDEVYFENEDTSAFVIGIRHEFSYLAVLKLEYQYESEAPIGDSSRLKLQFAIGF